MNVFAKCCIPRQETEGITVGCREIQRPNESVCQGSVRGLLVCTPRPTEFLITVVKEADSRVPDLKRQHISVNKYREGSCYEGI